MRRLQLEGGVPKIKAVMTPFPFFVDPDSTVAQARETMATHRIRHLPVQQGSELIGVISDHTLRESTDDSQPVRDAMSEDIFIVDMDRPLDAVLTHMVEHHVGCALVRHEGKLAGIFTPFDACRLLADALPPSDPPGGDGVA